MTCTCVVNAAAASWPVGVVRGVARALTGMGVGTKMRVVTEDGHFSLHLVLEQKSDSGLPVSLFLFCCNILMPHC